MERFLAAWSADPIVLAGLTLGAVLYARGWRTLRAHTRHRAAATWRGVAYAAGLVVLAVALLSPIGTLSDELFSLHMTQHLLLTTVVPILVLLGAPLVPFLLGLPPTERRGVVRLLLASRSPVRRVFTTLSGPPVALPLHLGVLLLWHVPTFYDAAQGRSALHDLEHALFVGTALLYWWPIIHPAGGKRRLGYGLAIPYVFAAMMATQVLGALLTFAATPLYATYRNAARISALSPLEDQQLAGLLMWIPTGLLYGATMLVLLSRFLRDDEQRQRADERRTDAALRAGGPAPAIERS